MNTIQENSQPVTTTPDNLDEDQFIKYHEKDLPEPNITTQKYLNCSDTAAELLANGTTMRGVAAKLDLHHETIDYWLRHSPHFNALVEHKKANLREELLGNIRQAAQKPHLWTASAWYLERNKVFQGEFDPPAVKVKQQIDLQARIFQHFQVEDIVTILEET